MTRPGDHPSAEELAEHLEGLLDADTARRVRSHLERCEECAATARGLSQVQAALGESAASASGIPADVAARIEGALAAESGAHREGRDRRVRRRVTGGLLAAAAVTVVAVGVVEVMDAGVGSGGGGAGGSAVQAEQHESGRPSDERRGGPSAQAFNGLRAGAATVRSWTTLIERVAAAHPAGDPPRERAECVAAALGREAARQGASYAVKVPGTRGVTAGERADASGQPADASARRGVVLLRPGPDPSQGVLVACEPRPRVLLRRGLAR